MYQMADMRWVVLVSLVLVGCPAPRQYAVERPGLDCGRSARVAHRTLETLGYTVTAMDEPSVQRAGAISGTKTGADGKPRNVRVVIRCSPQGVVLQPVEESFVTEYEFSRGFGYSFKSLVQQPDEQPPSKRGGLQVLVQVLDPFKQRLDLGEVANVGSTALVRVTVRNDTARAVRLDATRLSLVDAQGAAHEPLAGGALAGAIAGNGAGERVRTELFGPRPVTAGETRVGFLVYPAGVYREARVSIDDVETDETDGFVTPVE
jgi:hypothetical protein